MRLQVHILTVLLGGLLLAGCDGADPDVHRTGVDLRDILAKKLPAHTPRSEKWTTPPLPRPDHDDHYLEAHLQRQLAGDLAQADTLLEQVASGSATPRALRARARLRQAEMALVQGKRRQALAYLDQAREAAGSGHPLAMDADDRRARILAATPLANVRGPVPGSLALTGEPRAVTARFARAERQLAAYHRMVLRPTLENINAVLRVKRRALAAAVAAYEKVADGGGPGAQAAAAFRMGAMHHHLAEALAFEPPAELLPSVAARLRRRLRKESAVHLRKSLAHYRRAASTKAGAATSPWRALAAREVKTLARILK